MSELLLGNEPVIRLFAFAGIFAVMSAWEIVAPRRDQRIGRGTRWPSNVGIVVLDTVLVRLLFPTTAVGLALVAEAQGWGLFHVLALPIWVSVPLAVLGAPESVDAALEALRDPAPEMRWTAAMVLGRLGEPRAEDALIAALGDPHGEVRRQAAASLGYLGATKARPALEDLAGDDPRAAASCRSHSAIARRVAAASTSGGFSAR